MEINNKDYTTKTTSVPVSSTTSVSSTTGTTSTTGSVGPSVFTETTKTTLITSKVIPLTSTNTTSTTLSAEVTFTTTTNQSTESSKTLPSTTPTAVTEETTPLQDMTLVEQYAAQNGFDDKTVDDIIAGIKSKVIDGGALTDLEKAIIEEFEMSKDSVSVSENSQKIEHSKKVDGEYAQIRSSGGTVYENTSKALNKYLMDFDSEYQSITDETKKRAYRDSKLHNLIKVFIPDAKTKKNGTLNITQEQRGVALLQISTLCAVAAKEEKSIDELAKLPLDELKAKINQQEVAQMQAITQKLDLDNENKSTDQKMTELADLYFSKTDSKYNKLSPKEKEKYILEKSSELLSDVLGVNISSDDLKPGNSMFLKESALALFSAMSKKGIPVTEFVNLSAQEQAKLVMEIKNNTPNLEERLAKLPEKERQDAQVFFARTKIIASIDKPDGKVTDRDVFNELVKLRKQGKLTESQEILYKELSQLRYTKLLDTEAKVTSNVGKALLLGISSQDLIRSQLKYLNANKIRKDLESEKLNPRMQSLMDGVAADKSYTQFKVLREELLALGLSDKEIKQYFEKYGLDYVKMGHLSTAAASARNNGREVGDISNFVVTHCNAKEINAYSVSVKVAVQYLDDEQTANAIVNFNSTNSTILNAYNKGCHEYKSVDSCLSIANTVANSTAVSNECKSSYTKSFIATASPKNQVYYGQQLAKTGNVSVLEGLAAAEKYVDSTVRSQYSSNLNNAINNSNLTSAQRNNIQLARETGKTSYELEQQTSIEEQVQSNASAQNSTLDKNSYSQTSKTKTVRTSYTSSVTIEAAEPTRNGSSSKIPDNKMNYGDDVSKALNDKKTATLERISTIIDNYQKSQKSVESTDTKEVKQEQPVVEKQKQDAVIEKALTEVNTSDDISPEVVAELKSAYNSGGAAALYDKLSSVGGSFLQNKFLTVLAKYSDSNTLQNFASQYASDPNVILSLYEYSNNPSLLTYLNESSTMDLLAKGKIKMSDFLKYASPSTVALYISDLSKTGNTDFLKQIFGMLNLSQETYVKQHVTQLGGDDWMTQLSANMSKASKLANMDEGIALGSDKVPMGRSYDRMKQRGPFYFTA